MPKKPRSAEEIEAIKQNILTHALDLIVAEGYEGFSMRKLAKRLNVTAVTIYSYYENKDELYLAILTRGFENLYDDCDRARQAVDEPLQQLNAMIRAYVEFGLNETNFYVLMFTWNVPKYQDYIDTPLQETANQELAAALKVLTLFNETVHDLLADVNKADINEQDIRLATILCWCILHGYISGCANSLLDYIHNEPSSLKEMIVNLATKAIEHIVEELKAGRVDALKSMLVDTKKG